MSVCRSPDSVSPCLRRTSLALLLLAALTLSAPAWGSAAEDSARAVLGRAQELDRTVRRWRDRTRRMKIVIHDRRGGERLRDVRMSTLREDGSDDKVLAVFESPPEIRGTALLQFQHRDRDSDQWLYLPELRRVRKITSKLKDESFMGTDFSYRDLELLTDVLEWTEAEADARMLEAATVDARPAHRIELAPRSRDVGYRRVVITLSADDLVLRAMEMYGDGPVPSKRLELNRVEMQGAIPTAHEMIMRQPAEGTHTVVEITEVRYDQGLSAELFTKRSLERAGS